ncbi:VOC family protein [Neorhizobium sp. P12A]|uniref:VOC family protein n=1 Tax=Neorhizobium sp. P12A TaxID=2268027 RepID=UPI001FF01E41|nr:VOC family protein [Neorhizobium sp. P12A]
MSSAMFQEGTMISKGIGVPTPMSLELMVIPVSDVERSKRFYGALGWRLDIDHAPSSDYRIVQFTPSGSACSIMFGTNISSAKPGAAHGLHLVVFDIENAVEDLRRRGVEVGKVFHDVGGIFHHANGVGIEPGPNPQRKSYASYATFEDPDGNAWTLQEVTARLPGQPGDKSFTSQLSQAVWGEKA